MYFKLKFFIISLFSLSLITFNGFSAVSAQENEAAAQDILLTLEENMSEIRDADLASLLTQLEFLMTNKEAAQATFTRITSKSLFDFLG